MGLSAARQLAAKGANVVIISRNAEKLEKALVEVKVGGILDSTDHPTNNC